MSFEPKNERHAIHEVVFVLSFQRSFSPKELDRVVAAHDRWKAELPAMARDTIVQFVVGGAGQPPPAPNTNLVPPVEFTAHKRDGSLDWRMRFENQFLLVNCLTYTRWAEVWARARELMSSASELLMQDGNSVVGVGLQYIDMFIWKGEKQDYEISLLLRKGSPHVPESLWGRGALWHLHLGWFQYDGLPVGGRLLERMHIDAQPVGGADAVKMDSTLRLDCRAPVKGHQTVFGGEDAFADRVFGFLHQTNKEYLHSFITDEMAKRINLNV